EGSLTMRAWLGARRSLCLIVSLSFLPTAVVSESSATAAEPVFDVNVIDQDVAAAVRDNPRLRGAWVDLEYTPNADDAVPGTFTIRRVLDSGHAAAPRVEIDRLLQTWMRGANYRG